MTRMTCRPSTFANVTIAMPDKEFRAEAFIFSGTAPGAAVGRPAREHAAQPTPLPRRRLRMGRRSQARRHRGRCCRIAIGSIGTVSGDVAHKITTEIRRRAMSEAPPPQDIPPDGPGERRLDGRRETNRAAAVRTG